MFCFLKKKIAVYSFYRSVTKLCFKKSCYVRCEGTLRLFFTVTLESPFPSAVREKLSQRTDWKIIYASQFSLWKRNVRFLFVLYLEPSMFSISDHLRSYSSMFGISREFEVSKLIYKITQTTIWQNTKTCFELCVSSKMLTPNTIMNT